MKKWFMTPCACLLVVSLLAEDVVLSETHYSELLRRIERLEQLSGVSTAEVDAYTGASPRCDSTRVQVGTKGRFTIGGYGEATAKYCFYSNNYLRYSSPANYVGDRYGECDLPHVVLSLGYDFGRGWSMGMEVEFEHGGTESAVEIEEEEGGEYESEVERGGEVALEQFWVQKSFSPYANIRAGMQVVPVGALNAHHEPTQFFGVFRPEGEFTILPSTWHEVSLTFWGEARGWRYQAMLLPGLDSDRFNRQGWINPGAGSPYEFKIANTFAGALRIDNVSVDGLRLSLSGYVGNSFRNTVSRSYKELSESEKYKDIKGTVSIGSFDFAYNDHNAIVRGQVTYGHLSDAKLITQYNMSMRKDSPSSKQWVASDVIAAGVEVGYDFFSLNELLLAKRQHLYLFGRYEYYDSMLRYDGLRNNAYAWCGRHRMACGINYFPMKEIALKAEFSYAVLNKGNDASGNLTHLYNDEPAIAIGIVYAGFFDIKTQK